MKEGREKGEREAVHPQKFSKVGARVIMIHELNTVRLWFILAKFEIWHRHSPGVAVAFNIL